MLYMSYEIQLLNEILYVGWILKFDSLYLRKDFSHKFNMTIHMKYSKNHKSTTGFFFTIWTFALNCDFIWRVIALYFAHFLLFSLELFCLLYQLWNCFCLLKHFYPHLVIQQGPKLIHFWSSLAWNFYMFISRSLNLLKCLLINCTLSYSLTLRNVRLVPHNYNLYIVSTV